MTQYDIVVLGAGAAGMMAAIEAGRRGRRVLVVDHAESPGEKIRISGGGRCNFTNVNATPALARERFLSRNPRFALSALSRYQPQAIIDLVRRHGITFHEKTLGQLFCDGSARQIVDLLRAECDAGGVTYALGHPVGEIDHADGRFRVAIGNRTATAPALVIATGGPSIPKIGATDFAYGLARRFGHKIVEPRPALVPLTLGGDEALFRDLSGVSTKVVARTGKTAFREAALFTHKGLSGPAILQVSSYWRPQTPVAIDFLPRQDSHWLIEAKRTRPRASLKTVLASALPERLAEALADRIAAPGNLADLPDRRLAEITGRLADWRFMPSGTEGFAKAEVTIGGIATAGLSSKTMESNHLKGLYAIGEAVDVTGWLGGYNFQWAWASGWAAGQAL